jgi:hypothetical protein
MLHALETQSPSRPIPLDPMITQGHSGGGDVNLVKRRCINCLDKIACDGLDPQGCGGGLDGREERLGGGRFVDDDI